MVDKLELNRAIDFVVKTAFRDDPVELSLWRLMSHLSVRLQHAAMAILIGGLDQLGGDAETHVEVIREGLRDLKEHPVVSLEDYRFWHEDGRTV